MIKRLITSTTICAYIIMLFSLGLANSAYAQNQANTPIDSSLDAAVKSKIKRGAYYLFNISSQIKENTDELNAISGNINALERKIKQSGAASAELESQLKNLDSLIETNGAKIRAVTLQIGERANRVKIAEEDSARAGSALKQNESQFKQSLTAYYARASVFFENDDKINVLALLALDENYGSIAREREYVKAVGSAHAIRAEEIAYARKELQESQKKVEREKDILHDLQALLEQEKKNLTDSIAARGRLAEETRGRQAIYETLLEISRKEQEQVSVQIARLKENYAFVEKRLQEIGAAYQFPFAELGSGETAARNTELSWPVSPSNGLTAFFRDTEYLKTLGVLHNAIDIRLIQGSRVKAAKDGVVTKVADNGFAYSYIIIAHENKLLTLYGHLSEIIVNEGDIVRTGETIGLSGGIPGTKGAGWLTTGAHLHFEVFKDFKHVDPLEYLPLASVPIDSLPEKYLERLTSAEEKKIERRPSLSEAY